MKVRGEKRIMYRPGDLIIYGISGVCKVEAVGKINIPWIDKSKVYYTLSPIYQAGKIFAPIDTDILTRAVITHEEAQRLIDIIPSIDEMNCGNYDFKVLANKYNELIQKCNCADLLKIIKTIYVRKSVSFQQRKQFGQVDRKYMKQAEDLLYGEFAIALEMPKEKVKSYIENRVKELEYKQLAIGK